jgi:hypothetical protein
LFLLLGLSNGLSSFEIGISGFLLRGHAPSWITGI